MRDYFLKKSPIRFRFPIDGDFLNRNDGSIDGETLSFNVFVEAKEDCEIFVNSVACKQTDEKGLYTAEISISGYRNTLIAENKTEGTNCRIAVFMLPGSAMNRFRLSSDDNIRFLKELNDKPYNSIFDHPYLAVYKKAHDLYGAKVHLNLFYAFEEESREKFSKNHEYFDLSMMTERYKEEFCANADWLKLAFHSRFGYPSKPYKDADFDTVKEDCIAVYREIVRFAGKECVSDSTTIHWGEANLDGVRALRSLGFRSLTGYFKLNDRGEPFVSYYAPTELVEHIETRDFWKDTEEDIIFGRIDCVLNTETLDYVNEFVKKTVDDPHRGGFISIMIHEQYFYPDYTAFRPDFEARVLEPCKYLFEKGYKGAHISEIVTEQKFNECPAFYK